MVFLQNISAVRFLRDTGRSPETLRIRMPIFIKSTEGEKNAMQSLFEGGRRKEPGPRIPRGKRKALMKGGQAGPVMGPPAAEKAIDGYDTSFQFIGGIRI